MNAMGTTAAGYEFTFVVSGATVDDPHIVDTLEEQFEAMLFRGAGVDLLTVAAAGANAIEAAARIIGDISAAVPGLRIERVDRGLVGISEIAERTDRTRQNVTQWANGERQSTQARFPMPEGTAGRSRVWLWTEVNEWLRPLGLDDGFTYPTRKEMTLIDHLVAGQVINIITDLPNDEFAPQRERIRGRAAEVFQPGLLEHLAESTATTDEHGRHVIVLAAAEEPARRVLERISKHAHDVILMTEAGSRISAMVMSRTLPPQPTSVVLIPAEATMREWLALMQLHPGCAFALSTTDRSSADTPATRRGTVLSAA